MDENQKKPELPLVSVIIPAYNAEIFLEKTLDSVLAQTYKNIEVLVVDDGSQDRTAEIVESVAQRDHRVILLRQSNAGVAAARNLAIQKSKGEYIAPIDADDIWYPQNLEKQVQCILQAEPSVGVVYAWSLDINEQGLLTGGFRAFIIEGEVYTTLVCHNFLGNASASMIHRACFEKVGGYNCKLKEQNAQGCEDWDLYLRIAEHYQFRVVPEFLIGYRKIFNSMSCDYTSMAKSHYLMLQSVRQRHPEISAAIYQLSSSNFYMYLAHQSSWRGSERTTLFWLYQALRSDFITPFLRYGLYKLSIKSLLKLTTQSIASVVNQERYSSVQFKRKLSSKHQLITTLDLNKQRMGIYFMVGVGKIFHRSITLIFGSLKHQEQKKFSQIANLQTFDDTLPPSEQG